VVLTLCAAAVLAGMRSFTAIAGWVADVPTELLARLYTPPCGPPSKTTLWRVLTEPTRRRCTPELVRSIMRELGLVACQPMPWRHNLTESDPAAGPIPNLMCRDFTAQAPGQKMVGDITYIPTWEGWLFS
jgi:hypothetical protein